jgi:hypothetical protein
VQVLDGAFAVPADLDPVAELEAHLAVGWEYAAEVLVEAPMQTLTWCLPRVLGRLEPVDAGTTRLVGSTSNPPWYAQQLAAIPAPFHVLGCPELQRAARAVGERLVTSST